MRQGGTACCKMRVLQRQRSLVSDYSRISWHEYVKQLQAALPGLSEDNVKILNTFNLRVFYMTTYAGCADDKAFYAEFDRRLAMAKEKLGLM